ncbi:MAG: hypothetical protein QM589_16720 [Thermomicrobiales bacterium]
MDTVNAIATADVAKNRRGLLTIGETNRDIGFLLNEVRRSNTGRYVVIVVDDVAGPEE